MFVPLYFGLVVLGNGVEPFFSARKADVLSDRRTEQTAGFFTGFWPKNLFAVACPPCTGNSRPRKGNQKTISRP